MSDPAPPVAAQKSPRIDHFRSTAIKRHSQRLSACLKGVESRCGAVALGRTYPLPPLSSGGALVVTPSLRFHIPLIEPDRRISRIRLSDKTSRFRATPSAASEHLLKLIGFPISEVHHHVLRLS